MTTTDVVTAFVQETDALSAKQAAERKYEEARGALIRAQDDLDAARTMLREARGERAHARNNFEEAMRTQRKPRQRNVVRRILDVLQDAGTGLTRRQIIEMSGLDATSVSTTLTRCKRAGFVSRDGENFTGMWVITEAGDEWRRGETPMPKQ